MKIPPDFAGIDLLERLDDKPEQALRKLSFDRKMGVENMVGKINPRDPQTVVDYGIEAQGMVSSLAGRIIERLRRRDAVQVSDVLSRLIGKMRGIRVDELDSPGFLEQLPLIGHLFGRETRVEKVYGHLTKEIDLIVTELEKCRDVLREDILMLEDTHKKNLAFFEEVNDYMLAGQLKVKDLSEKVLPSLQQRFSEEPNPILQQNINDLKQFIHRFEIRVHDLKLSRAIALQTSVQIRIVQHNSQALAERVQSTLLTTIPLWHNQVSVTLAVLRQRKVLALHRHVSEATNDLLRKNSEILRKTSLDAAREQEKGLVEVETLKKVHSDLLSTLEETLKVQTEGRKKRLEAEAELSRMEENLRGKLEQYFPEDSS